MLRSFGSSPPVALPVPHPVRICVPRSKVAGAVVPGQENGECHCQMPEVTVVTSELLHTPCHSALAVTPVKRLERARLPRHELGHVADRVFLLILREADEPVVRGSPGS